ncbi:MAG: hypothetical protein KDK62_01700 [Chlamydiia bacterium]|nr:hypothetical protein [Chlamydiia bacterium]
MKYLTAFLALLFILPLADLEARRGDGDRGRHHHSGHHRHHNRGWSNGWGGVYWGAQVYPYYYYNTRPYYYYYDQNNPNYYYYENDRENQAGATIYFGL